MMFYVKAGCICWYFPQDKGKGHLIQSSFEAVMLELSSSLKEPRENLGLNIKDSQNRKQEEKLDEMKKYSLQSVYYSV